LANEIPQEVLRSKRGAQSEVFEAGQRFGHFRRIFKESFGHWATDQNLPFVNRSF
jgi:hypothetical protein